MCNFIICEIFLTFSIYFMLLLIFGVYFIESKLVYIAIFSNKMWTIIPYIPLHTRLLEWLWLGLGFFYESLVLITWTKQMILNLHYQISEYEAMFGISNKNNFYSFQLESQQVQKFWPYGNHLFPVAYFESVYQKI